MADTQSFCTLKTSPIRPRQLLVGLWLALVCGSACAAGLVEAEAQFARVVALHDRIALTLARGRDTDQDGTRLGELQARFTPAREDLARSLATVETPASGSDDARALARMRQALDADLASPGDAAMTLPAQDCDQPVNRLATTGLSSLQERLYACFAAAAGALDFNGETLDRLGVMARLAVVDDASQRRALWLALAPVWRAVNGGNEPDSPYRVMVRLNAARLSADDAALGASVRAIGIEPGEMRQWLVTALEAWRDSLPAGSVEPWDWAWSQSRASRTLQSATPLASMRAINDRFYADLGADPAWLNVRYDLAPRAGKDPVAFTTFGRRPHPGPGRGDPGQPWVFASYSEGGLGNLAELLHETGHAVHIAAIRTRPAFTDWPDSDIFTEGIADLAAWDLWTPAWQRRYLGFAAGAQDGQREKLAPIMLDIAWSLFELQLHEQPEADPNALWTALTSEYLRIRAHPDYSWWALRGQLLDAPGYMLNYAAGAVLVADLRARLDELGLSGAAWYDEVSRLLYRFGLERDSATVVRDFLGRPPSPRALLDEIRALAQSPDSTPMPASAAK